MDKEKEKELVKSYLYLNAVLPQLEEIIAYDAEARELTKGWNCTIQMHVPGGAGVRFVFKDGKCEAKLGAVSMPTISLRIPTPEAANKMIENTGTVIPMIWGFWNIGKLGKFMKLTKLMEKYLRPSEEDLKNKDFFEFHTRVKLMMAVYGMKAVGEHDTYVKGIVSKVPNGPMEIKVLPDGPVAHIVLDNGKFAVAKGPAANPMVVMEIKDIKLAYDMLNANVEFMEELGLCRIRLRGHVGMAESLAVVMERIGLYIS
ncbi:MAG TPA: hypothetical protein PKH33_14950 [bacterium]|nr:hypothetical protein [bacterium]